LLIFLARSALSEFSLSSLPVVFGFLYTLLGLARNLQYWWWIRKQILQNFGVPNAFLKDFFSFLPICVLYFISWLRSLTPFVFLFCDQLRLLPWNVTASPFVIQLP
jgi:hypothetical protein